jgi:hypothetical protein
VASADIIAAPLKAYAWATAKAACPTECGGEASAPADTVMCKEDGAAAADASCVARLGAKPATATACTATIGCLALADPGLPTCDDHTCGFDRGRGPGGVLVFDGPHPDTYLSQHTAGENSFGTFVEAAAAANDDETCNGITKESDGRYTLRIGSQLQPSLTSESSWLKSMQQRTRKPNAAIIKGLDDATCCNTADVNDGDTFQIMASQRHRSLPCCLPA